MIGHCPEDRQMVELLTRARRFGVPFALAWDSSLARIRRGRQETNPRWALAAEGLEFARSAYERAYNGQPPVRQDVVALALLHVMEFMLDDSEDAQPRLVELMSEAA